MKNLGLILICTLLVSVVRGEIYTSTELNKKLAKEDSFQPIKKRNKKRKKRKQTKVTESTNALDNKISISEENQPTTKKKRK